MDELSQWCEIDGHKWITGYFSHGLVLGPKTIHMWRRCSQCTTTESSVSIPKDTDYKHYLPIYAGTIF